MTVYKSRSVEAALKKKGFVKVPGDHNFFILYNEKNEKTCVFTKTSHNGQDINDSLASRMQKQTHLNKQQFKDLIECPLTKEEYYKILREQGII